MSEPAEKHFHGCLDPVSDDFGDMFCEPDEFYRPPEQQSVQTYARIPERVAYPEVAELTLRLIRQHSLWGHLIWNAAEVLAEMLDNPHHAAHVAVNGKLVVELGAGAAVPSLICALNGATVTITDYPEPELITNLAHNVDTSLPRDVARNVHCRAHLWGTPFDEGPFDVLILSDLVFNHAVHAELVRSVVGLMAVDGQAIVTFSHHKPAVKHKDLHFFTLCEEAGLLVETIYSQRKHCMFENDVGSEEDRATVWVKRLTWRQATL